MAGVGPVIATALVAAVNDAHEFRNGRQLAAWLGLVPRQHSSGGKPLLLGISKRGDRYLRTLLIHGARSRVYRYRNLAEDKASPIARWVQRLIARRGAFNIDPSIPSDTIMRRLRAYRGENTEPEETARNSKKQQETVDSMARN